MSDITGFLGKLAISNVKDYVPLLASPYMQQPPKSLVNSFAQPQSGYVDIGATRPEDLPRMALPVLEFLEKVQPHIVIGCDRGGRLFSLAMYAAWKQTRGGQPFPTLDGKVHFARISKSEDVNVLQDKVDAIIANSLRFGKQRGNTVKEDEKLRVVFVDDWVIGGGTKSLAGQLLKKHDAESFFTVMCGQGADATGNPAQNTSVSWHDRPEEIGINYLSALNLDSTGTITQKLTVVAVKAEAAKRNRQAIQQAARRLVEDRVLAGVA